MSADVFPEHRKIISELLVLHSRGQLPHAVLITSVSGIGLASAATRLCATLLCEHGHDEACGDCRSCHRVAAATHGDYRWVGAIEGKASIGVDQIREASDFIAKTAGYGAQKVLVISEAEKMTTGAANALLKTLEEPQGNSLILLLSQKSWLLPATIRSRCQMWRLAGLEPTTSMAFLNTAGVAVPSDIAENPRALERLVLLSSEGKMESYSVVTRMVETMLSTDAAVPEAAAVLQRFDLSDSVELVVRALEERLIDRQGINTPQLTLLQLHRVVASLLQRMRNGAVPAKESTCYEIASLISKARQNDVAGIDGSRWVLGA